MQTNNFGVKKRPFLRRKPLNGKRVIISREMIEKATAVYLKNGGEITKLEFGERPVNYAIPAGDFADEYLMD